MNLAAFVLSWSPVLLLAVLAVGLKRPALELSVYGVVFTAALAHLAFQTPLSVILMAAVDGVVTTAPLLLVVLAGILLSHLLIASRSIDRIVAWFLQGLRHPRHRHLFISLGICNFLEGASVIAEPIVAPMLRSAGVEPAAAAALSIIGYAGLMSVEMAGIIITVLALVTGLPMAALAAATAWLSVPAVLTMGLKSHTGAWYPLFVPLLGWVGTFLTGYGVASLMLFGELQVHAAALLGVSAVWLAAGLTVGSAIGSISSPFKIAIAAPMCGAQGQEGEILRRTIPLGLAASFLLGLVLWAL